MSYLPSSRLYEREPEVAAVAAAPRTEPKPTVMPPAPAVVAPVTMVAVPPPAPRATTKLPKEWLAGMAPVLRVEMPTPAAEVEKRIEERPVKIVAPPPPPRLESRVEETITRPALEDLPLPSELPPARKRNIFHNAQKVVLRHLDRAKTKAQEPKEPDLLWFAVMVTGSLCMGLMIWGAYSALPRFGNVHAPLRAQAVSSKLKVSQNVPVNWIQEATPIHPQPHVPIQVPVHVPPLVPPVAPPLNPPIQAMPVPPPTQPEHRPITDVPEFVVPQHVEAPLTVLPERKDPAVFVHANLGETPMIRTWKKLAESSMLLTAFTVASANNLLAGMPTQIPVDYSKQIDELTKAVKSLSDQVANMKIDDKLTAVKTELNDKISKIKLDAPKDNSNEFLLLANRLEQLEKLIGQMVKNPAAPAQVPMATANVNLDEIKSKLGNIEQAILKLQPSEKRIALSAPDLPAIPKVGTSHVIFVNLYGQDLWLWVNQKQHRVPANSTLTLDSIASGPATIEVRSPEGIFHRSSPTLVANETFTLTAR